MESILQLMYLGEAKFYHERMREFIKVAQDLEVKNIGDDVELTSEETEDSVQVKKDRKEIEKEYRRGGWLERKVEKEGRKGRKGR